MARNIYEVFSFPPPAARKRKPPAIVIVNAERLFGTVVSGRPYLLHIPQQIFDECAEFFIVHFVNIGLAEFICHYAVAFLIE